MGHNMSTETVLHLPDGKIISDKTKIDKLLRKRRAELDARKTTPPNVILQGINISTATLAHITPDSVGTLQFRARENEEPYSNPIFPIPDIFIDLSTESDYPSDTLSFALQEGSRRLTIDVIYDSTQLEYQVNGEKNEKLFESVGNSLKKILQCNNWQHGKYPETWTPVK